MKTRIIIIALLALFLLAWFAETGKSVPLGTNSGTYRVQNAENRHAFAFPSRSNSRQLPPLQARRGIRPSQYVGKWYDPQYESNRRCIVRRESNGQYGVENSYSSAAGAYQMLASTSNWVAREIKRPDLINKPASKWTRWEQDKAFWRLWAHGSGKGHWAGGNYSCW